MGYPTLPNIDQSPAAFDEAYYEEFAVLKVDRDDAGNPIAELPASVIPQKPTARWGNSVDGMSRLAQRRLSVFASITELEALGSDDGFAVGDLRTLASGTTCRCTAVTASTSTWAMLHGVVDFRDFGAVGDGVTDDTAACQAALDSLDSGSVLAPSPGTYLCGNLQLSNKTHVELWGHGVTILWTGTTGVDVGFELVGTLEDILICGFRFVGDGVAINRHNGIYMFSGATTSNIRIRGVEVATCIVGIYLGSPAYGWVVSENYIHDLVGEVPGSGYGIATGPLITTSERCIICNNIVRKVGRHSIYIGGCDGLEVYGNWIDQARFGATEIGGLVSAMEIARSQNVNVHDNWFTRCANRHLMIDAADSVCTNIRVTNNQFVDPVKTSWNYPLISIGDQSGIPALPNERIVFSHNIAIYDAGDASTGVGAAVQVHRVDGLVMEGNWFEATVENRSHYTVIFWAGVSGGAIHSSDWFVRENIFKATRTAGSQPVAAVEFAQQVATDPNLVVVLEGNILAGTTYNIICDVILTNPNIEFRDTVRWYAGYTVPALEALGNNHGIVPGSLVASVSGNLWRCVTATLTTSTWVPVAGVVDFVDYGAAGDGVTNDTTACQTALTALQTGWTLKPSPGTYLCGNLQLSNKTNVRLEGGGATIQWTGSPGPLGLQLVGTCANVVIRNWRLIGDGVVGSGHHGVYCLSGQSMTEVEVAYNIIQDVTSGITFVGDPAGTMYRNKILYNAISNIVGTIISAGFGIFVSAVQAEPSSFLIEGNSVDRAQRNAIACVKANGVSILGNTVDRHRQGVVDGSIDTAAILIGRSRNVICGDNHISRSYDACLLVFTDNASFPAENITISNNEISDPQKSTTPVPLVMIGFPSGTTGDIQAIRFIGNQIEAPDIGDATTGVGALFVAHRCEYLEVVQNTFRAAQIARTYYPIIAWAGPGGAYSDHWTFRDNTIVTLGSSTADGIEMASAVCTSSMNVIYDGNKFSIANGQDYECDVPITNPNLTFLDEDPDGLNYSATVYPRHHRSIRGTKLVAGDFVLQLAGGWGASAVVTPTGGSHDLRWGIKIDALGGSQGANPIITWTYKDGAFPKIPFLTIYRSAGNQITVNCSIQSISATQAVLVFNGTPVNGQTYTFIGRLDP